MQIRYRKNPHQKAFHDDLTSKQLLLTSGFGAGKSYALCMKAFQLSYLNRPYAGGIIAPSLQDFKKDMLPLFEEILQENNITYVYNQADKWFRFPWSPGKLWVTSAEKAIRGPNWAYALVNEPGILPHGFKRYREILGRVRIKGAKYPQIALAGTPEGRMNWLFEQFVEYVKEGSTIIYGNTSDNTALHIDYIKTLEQNYDSITLQSYLHGKFVNMNGSMFYYSFTREKNVDQTIERTKRYTVHIGMDFNVDNMTCSMWNILENPRRAVCFDEIVLNNSNTNKLCDAIIARGYNPRDCIIYPDPTGNSRKTSGFSDVTILKNYGFQAVRFKPKADPFRDRQLCVNNLLDKGLIKIAPNCKIVIRDLESVEQSTVDYSKVKDNKDLTHASDGLDYFLMIEFSLSGRKPIRMTPR